MRKLFTDKVVLVVGASRGIGAAVAKRMGSEGASVVVTYVGEQGKAAQVGQAIETAGGRALLVKADITNSAEVLAVFDQAVVAFGRIDIVINVAGASVFKPLATYTDEEFEKMLALNVRGAFYVLRAAANHVVEGGRILHVSTGGTVTPMAASGVYAGTKAAGERIALSLAKELGSKRITVNTISPGVTETDGLVMPQQALDQLKGQTPLGRLGQPEDLADAIAILLSDDGRWINGQNIQVNGGLQ